MDRLDQEHELRTPAVISDEVDGEVLAIDLDRGIYYVVPPAAVGVWRALTTGTPARALCAGRPVAQQRELTEFLDRLLDAGLVRPAGTAPTTTPGDPVVWDGAPLVLEAHDDLADLLGLDPVHDADEAAGWPTAPGG